MGKNLGGVGNPCYPSLAASGGGYCSKEEKGNVLGRVERQKKVEMKGKRGEHDFQHKEM